MKKIFIYGLLIFCLLSGVAIAEKASSETTEVLSTEGLEINKNTSINIVKSKNDKNPAKTKKKNRNKYLRYVKKTDRSKDKKRVKERDLDFLNKQLEIKKNKLEKLNSKVEKGENQE